MANKDDVYYMEKAMDEIEIVIKYTKDFHMMNS